ncbi:GNAT family N-acetyltransferase [Streptomyces sp. 6N223]|uniref:GNAT family N-acetyltransferase n=1 Tax=Streptomyces sp. 6N223 TaxID=3457412 RepID=UPI003FD383C3
MVNAAIDDPDPGPGSDPDPDPDLDLDLDLAEGLRLRTLTPRDARLLVEATSGENATALWGPHPRGPYAHRDARAALQAWDLAAGGQVSYGLLDRGTLVGALGLMPDSDGPGSAELAYWIRPERRRQGLALRGVTALTTWAHDAARLPRLWLEIRPDNTASLRLATRAGYRFEQRVPRHCRAWTAQGPGKDTWHDCLIWAHQARQRPRRASGRDATVQGDTT